MPHRYQIEPVDPAAHLFEVRLRIEAPDPDGQQLRMPAWIPGSYMIRDYARNVIEIRAESNGESVALNKLDKSTWQAAPTGAPLTVVARVYAFDTSVRGAHLDTTHGFFNGTCCFLEVVGQEDERCDLEILPPPHTAAWQVATSMRVSGAERYGFGGYTAADYAELIDHPVEMGILEIAEFDAGGVPHAIAIRGRIRADLDRLTSDLKAICEQHMSLLGKPSDLDRYLFLLHAPGSGYGGLEHRWSSANICSRDSLPVIGEEKVTDAYRNLLGLLSHEYFHLWNVKRMKPAEFSPYRLHEESHTELLWVFEGITSYYDDLALLRSGRIDESSYLELIGQTITRVLAGDGRLRQSVAESSFDAWTKFYKQDANAGNAIVSYYAKGSLIALALDLHLRRETEGAVALDDVMRECWKRYGESADGMPERGFEQVCNEVSGLELTEFFDSSVHGTEDPPLDELLGSHGIRLHLRPAAKLSDKGGKSADGAPAVWFGATLTQNNGRTTVATVANGGPAEAAGLAPGDELLALDGLRISASTIDRRLKELQPGDCVTVAAFRGDEFYETSVQFEATPVRVAWLESCEDVDTDTEGLKAAWLS